ncbi:MAG: DedA family protein [bacterium]|nr:DedA family protein [bacterium]
MVDTDPDEWRWSRAPHRIIYCVIIFQDKISLMVTPDNVIELLTTYKYHLLFPWAVVEGPIISVIGGFLWSLGIFDPFKTYFLLVIADLIGDTFYYSVGRFGGRPFIRRWGRYLGVTEERLLKTEVHFQHHAGKTLAIGKTQPWGMLVLVTSGLSKMSYFRFILLNFAVTIFKSILLMLLGYYFGKSYTLISRYFGLYGKISVILTALLMIAYFLFIKRRKL